MLYDILLALYFFPKFFYEKIFLKKKRSCLLERMGWKAYPSLLTSSRPLIWLHAVSVGETKAMIPLFKKLKERYPSATFIVSSLTETGHEEAKRSLSADLHLFLPFDFSFSSKKVLDSYPIDLLIYVESDLWYNFSRFAKKRGAKLILVSGKMSKKSAKRYQMLSFFSRKLFALFDKICVQNELFQERFLQAGAPREKICITGNLKFDLTPSLILAEEKEEWRKKFFSTTNDLFLTIASTHPREEEALLTALEELLETRKDLKIFLAPRHPERFAQVERLLMQKMCSFTKLSLFQKDKQIILIDRLGFLPVCYSLSHLAIVGGSFIEKVGGHNILEPISYQLPVFFGPHMSSQEEMSSYVLHHHCGHQTSLPELPADLLRYLTDAHWQKSLSKNCSTLLQKKECVDKTLLEIEEIF